MIFKENEEKTQKNWKVVKSVPRIKIREGEHFEQALRRFKKSCEKFGILSEIKKREFYEKPSVSRKKKAINARRRSLKKTRKFGT